MQIKVDTKAVIKGLKRKNKKFNKQFLKGIHREAVIEMSNMDVPRVTSTLQRSYGASKGRNSITFGSGGGDGNTIQYANWIETGKRGSVRRIGGLKYYNKDVSTYVTSAPRSLGLYEFKRKKKKILKYIPRIVRSININNL